MTFQTSRTVFDATAVAATDLGEPRSFQDLLSQVDAVAPPGPSARPVALSDESAGLSTWKARKVLAYIETHLDRVIYSSELARVAGHSTSYFGRAFKKRFGECAHVYVARRRVEAVQEMIVRGEQTLVEIALACGFADQPHMTRIFSRFVGTSPSRWRRAQRAVRPSARAPVALA